MSWYRQWFADELYMHLYAHRDVDEAHIAVDLFQQVTDLPKNAIVLDLACGTGRHAFELARRGYRVLAADLSPTLLAVAKRKTQKYATTLRLFRADMRQLPLHTACDAVVQLFTAFGYFASDEENAAVLAEVRESLRPGGWYMLDFLNADELRHSLLPYSKQQFDGIVVEQFRSIDHGRVEKRIVVHSAGEQREFRESVRLFTLPDFQRMFRQAGFSDPLVFGTYAGAAFSASSPRCIMFARVP
jgi:SAM-dependent methyltransferase